MDGMRALNKDGVSDEDMWKAMVVGWGIEWLQAYFWWRMISWTSRLRRRGQPCWYRQPHVKMNAINDGILLEMQIYKLLKRHVGPKISVQPFVGIIPRGDVPNGERAVD